MKDILMETFRVEAAELLSELEAALLVLEAAPDDSAAIGRVFRCLHTIKGSGAMAGFNSIAAFAHELEDILESLREKSNPITRELADLVLAAVDVIHLMLEAPDSDVLQGKTEEIMSALRKLVPGPDGQGKSAAAPGAPGGNAQQAPEEDSRKEPCADLWPITTYRISFKPNSDVFNRGINPAALLSELRGLGDCRIVACLDAISPLYEMNPEECRTSWNIVLSTSAPLNAIRDVFIFVEDDCELRIDAIGENRSLTASQPKKLGEMLVETGDVTPEQVNEALSKQKRLGQMLVEEGVVSSGRVQAALMEQQHLEEIRVKGKERSEQSLSASIRVSAAKLDSMVDLVGELVTVQASLRQVALSRKIPELRMIAEQVDRLTSELRDNTMSLRMLPIGETFAKFNRLIRDLSLDLSKEVVLTTEGAEVELDKTVIERLHDPLVHMIRNSIDHGIEDPETRSACGKNRKGVLHLSAEHSGAHVLVKISDDGAGLDPEALLARGIEKGLVQPDAELCEREIFSLIFTQGFSTAKEVTNVSGRGVGMDVVKRSIDSLGGSIEIASKKGTGTTITLKLPLTLAIIDGLLVRAADSHFVFPLCFVEECVELTMKERGKNNGRQLSVIRQNLVPFIRLRDLFSLGGEIPPIEQIVITDTPDGKVGLVVDKVVGQHQTVIKNLGKIYRNVSFISGTTILGDGAVALIVDIPKIINSFALENINREEAI